MSGFDGVNTMVVEGRVGDDGPFMSRQWIEPLPKTVAAVRVGADAVVVVVAPGSIP